MTTIFYFTNLKKNLSKQCSRSTNTITVSSEPVSSKASYLNWAWNHYKIFQTFAWTCSIDSKTITNKHMGIGLKCRAKCVANLTTQATSRCQQKTQRLECLSPSINCRSHSIRWINLTSSTTPALQLMARDFVSRHGTEFSILKWVDLTW